MKIINPSIFDNQARNALNIALLIFAVFAASGQSKAQNTSSIASNERAEPAVGVATFAGGCFWCTESDFDKIPGVTSTTSGYIGGTVINPTYKQVSAGNTGHVEAVQIRFDPAKTNFAKLLAAYWPTIDPLTPNRQFCDSGTQYRSAIFYHNADQRQQVEASIAALVASSRFTKPIVTDLLPATTFYPAEEYHQDFHTKNPIRYKYYRYRCGRDARLKQVWNKKN
ncbi:peptide-methionine (S)-S-oxide reductase MsrA [Candidatus Nitrotoga sp. M5]|uniref:peptide-methionine (S)-S-oxide reductase MsrA n=1 Tax=Candidatus Nitrotoga sp. M5 TaxID=2890409 RepID=UPI001EF23CDC|nr:peptide-methionine (S)-S-oxide reductase MsrA [Candidatus Nitrotoga sp. M5]CAH1385541.1 Peptide methionine sulfoxide reductase MsrA [Candidatus Nitrotoga sp. M5]